MIVDPTLEVKRDLIQLAGNEAIAHGVTVSAVLRAFVDHELRPGFEEQIDHYLVTRGLASPQALGLASELLGGRLGLYEVLSLGVVYLDHDLTTDRATELLAWVRRLRQAAFSDDQKQRRAEAVAGEMRAEAAHGDPSAEASSDAS